MTPPPRAFRLVYRSFHRIEFDQAKSEEVLVLRGFDLAHVSRVFPGNVLEREDKRDYPEPRYQVIGECVGEVYFIVYTRVAGACRLITAWVAERHDRELWYDITR